jgi:hypothetical protein
MQFLRGSRFHGPRGFASCDGAIEGFGSLTPAPIGYSVDRTGRLWRCGSVISRPLGFRLTEEGEIIEDTVLAEKEGFARPAAPSHSRRLP